jgi:hypothetical protein
MQVCLYEDRPRQIVGLKVLLLSLERHCPAWTVRLRFPCIPDAFREWLRRFPRVELQEEPLSSSGSYNVKPAVLLDGLASGAERCLWLDTDVLVNGSLGFVADAPVETILVSQDPWEYADGSTHRCETMGLASGRSLPGPLNSALVRVTRQHEMLLQAWLALVATDRYLAEQRTPVDRRNPHILGDQDMLSALLASREFADIPVVRLLHGREMLQHHGAGAYPPRHRWANLTHGMPPLIHAMGTIKPWAMPERPAFLRAPRDYYERTYLELSPYVHFAKEYRSELGGEEEGWLETRTVAGKLCTLAAWNRPAIKGVTQAVVHRMLSPR